jgi:oligoribonuclease
MKYISIDIETTGLDPVENDILEIGAYLEDTNQQLPREKLPSFHCYVWKETYRGNAYALAMNAHIIGKIVQLKKDKDPSLLKPEEVAPAFKRFLHANRNQWSVETFVNGIGPFNLAGKNIAGFDLPFLNQLPEWNGIKFHRRIFDPAPLYFDPISDDVLPDLTTCKKRAGLSEYVAHIALDDAWDVISLIRYKRPLSL